MATAPLGATWTRFQELVFSDLQRYRPGDASWLKVATRCLTLPGLIGSVILRAQQCLFDSGRTRSAHMLRTVGVVLLNMDLFPGMKIGPGLLLAHPGGVTMGGGLTIGTNVSLAGGVTCAMRYPDAEFQELQEYATICDGAIIGAHAVLVGGVTIGRNAMVGANSVVLSDVPEGAVVLGSPARRIGNREAGDSAAEG